MRRRKRMPKSWPFLVGKRFVAPPITLLARDEQFAFCSRNFRLGHALILPDNEDTRQVIFFCDKKLTALDWYSPRIEERQFVFCCESSENLNLLITKRRGSTYFLQKPLDLIWPNNKARRFAFSTNAPGMKNEEKRRWTDFFFFFFLVRRSLLADFLQKLDTKLLALCANHKAGQQNRR